MSESDNGVRIVEGHEIYFDPEDVDFDSNEVQALIQRDVLIHKDGHQEKGVWEMARAVDGSLVVGYLPNISEEEYIYRRPQQN